MLCQSSSACMLQLYYADVLILILLVLGIHTVCDIWSHHANCIIDLWVSFQSSLVCFDIVLSFNCVVMIRPSVSDFSPKPFNYLFVCISSTSGLFTLCKY